MVVILIYFIRNDKKDPTLTLVKSHLDYRFGGFTNIEWVSSSCLENDKEAFLFSLTKDLKLKQKGADSSSIYCQSNFGPTFGYN